MLFNRSSFLVFIVVCFIGILNGKDIPVSTHNVTVTIAASGFYENSSSTTDDKPLLSTPGIAVVHTTPEVSSGSSSVASTLPHTAKWNVTQDGSVCILFQSGIRITFNYTVKATNESKIGFADVPSEAISTGVCDAEVQVISLIFYDNWNLTFTFIRNNTEYFISSAALSYKLLFGHQPFPEAKDFISSSVHHINEYGDFKSEVGKSSVCTSQFTLLNEAEPNSIGLLSANLYDTRVEAFRGNVSDTDFSVMGNRCSNDEISILIPIIVGACLAGLIVVVLVAYVIGRHRTKRGYLNV